MKILFIVNDAAFFVSHRLPIAVAAKAAGYDVHTATAPGPGSGDIEAAGIAHHPIVFSRSGTNPVRELFTLLAIRRVIRDLSPDLVHLITPKAVVYGGIVARLERVPAIVAAISGLGHIFSAKGVGSRAARALVRRLYRMALATDNASVIFQNPTDRDVLVGTGAVSHERVVMIRGSGVDLTAFRVLPEPVGVPAVTFAARLLRAKGVYEFVDAARSLRGEGVRARFWLVGAPDPENPTGVPQQDIEQWRAEGAIEVLGNRTDMASIFAMSNLVVLPSYYGEGLPKVLVEAAACGRCIVTTDSPGCRDAIEADSTGVLVPPHDTAALTNAIRELLADSPRRMRMGRAGRALAEREYSIGGVVDAHLQLYATLLERVGRNSLLNRPD